ncbi:MAG: ribonuclease D [Ferrimicrobium sp.]
MASVIRRAPSGASCDATVAPEVVWINNADALAGWIERVKHTTAVAVDTEFHRERSYFPKLALVQLGTCDSIALVDALAVDLTVLAGIFRRPTIEFIFHASDQDLEILERAVGERPISFFDTQIAAGFLGYARVSLTALVSRYLQIGLSKGARLSDWLQRPLTVEQLNYAANDVVHLITLRDRIRSELVAKGRDRWAAEEMEAALAKRRLGLDPDQAWVRIRECRGLNSEGRLVAAHVARWRELRAQELDLPPRHVLSDLAVAGIAQSAPKTSDDLLRIRGVEPRRTNHRMVEQLLETVSRAHSDPASLRVVEVADGVPPTLQPTVLFAASFVHSIALKLGIDATLVGSRDDIASFVLNRSGPISVGWRHEVAGAELGSLLDGTAGLRARPLSGELEMVMLTGLDLSVDRPER